MNKPDINPAEDIKQRAQDYAQVYARYPVLVEQVLGQVQYELWESLAPQLRALRKICQLMDRKLGGIACDEDSYTHLQEFIPRIKRILQEEGLRWR